MSRPRLTRPASAQWFVTWGMAIAGALVLLAVGRHAAFPRAPVLLLIAVLAAAAEYMQIPLPGAGYQTFGPAVSLPVIALLGPVPAAWTAALGVLIGNGLLRRRRFATIAFNFGQRILSILVAGLAWNTFLLGHPTFARIPLGGEDTGVSPAILGLMLVYGSATTVQVAGFLWGTRQEPFWSALASGAMWRLPTSVILGTFGLSIGVALVGARILFGREFGQMLTALLTISLIALLYISRRQQFKDLAHLHGGIADMLHSLDLPAVLNTLADQVTDLAKPDMLWIALRRDDGADEIALARAPGVDLGDLAAAPPRSDRGAVGWALAHRQPQRVHDYPRDPRWTAENERLFGPSRVRAMLVVPLMAAEELVGAIALTHRVPGYFTEYHEQVIKTLTAQAAVVLRNAALYNTAKRNIARFEALKAISEQINSQHDLEAVFDLIAESARDLLGADRCGLYLGRAGSDVTHTMAKGLPADYLERVAGAMQKGEGLGGRTMELKRPIVVADSLTAEGVTRAWAERLGYRTVAVFPLSYRGDMIGVLALYHDAVHPYGPSDLELGTAFASQAAIAVQNTRLRQEAEDKAHQLALLNRAFTRVATSLRPDELFDTLVDELHTTLGYPLVIIRLLEGDHLRHAAHRGYSGVRESTHVNEGIVGRVARTGRPAFITDVSRDSDFIRWDPRVTQEACVPIMSRGRVAGVINVEMIEPRLTQGDCELLTTLAGYATVALEKAQLYEQTQALATTDGLTGLLNYRAFWEALQRELERSMRYGLPLSLIMIEIDKFKRYNDTYGHLRGDEVIRLVARVLTQEHRAQIDVVARYGGDEFMILLPHTQKITAAEIAERVRRAVESTPLISVAEVASVTLSLGVAGYPEDGKSADALVEAADRLMYRAKERGGNAVAVAASS